MRDRWSDVDARTAVDRWGERWGEALAVRAYTSRLIGAESDLVLHGGGNTSVKDDVVDLFGDPIPAVLVKGSGWDLASIEPAGFTPIDLGYARRLRSLPALSDEAMVEVLRARRLRSDAPDGSIETLLHAFLPHRFVDHSHADAILALTNRRDGAKHARDALGERVAIVPYVKAGFDLAKVAADWFDDEPRSRGLVLLHHGLFTFADTAQGAYRHHIALVTAAERYLDARARTTTVPVTGLGGASPVRVTPEAIAPLIRAAAAEVDPRHQRWIVGFRSSPHTELPPAELETLVAAGPLTPDHTLRTKPRGLVIDPGTDPAGFADRVRDGMGRYAAAYEAYFEACAGPGAAGYTRLDPVARVVWVAGVGLFTVGATASAASAAADIAEHTLATVRRGQGLGPVTPLTDAQLFEMEYWSLEQRKLGKAGAEPTLARRIALVTGAGGAIGAGVVRQLLAAGAHVLATDRDPGALARLEDLVGRSDRLATFVVDVTDTDAVDAGFDAASRRFGGVDLVVANAGIAATGRIEALGDEAAWHATEVNYMGTLRTLRAAARVFGRQGARIGGDVVVVSTKNVAAPGAAFGAYSASKAAAHQLARVAALELAPLGVRVNLVAPDAVFAEGPVRSALWAEVGPDRARARGLDPDDLTGLAAYYRDRNLLKAEVTGSHVGYAVVFLASGRVPTTGAVLPIDGGLPEAFPR